MKTFFGLILTCLVAVAPVQAAGLIPQPVNARLSSSVQSPYDLCFYMEQHQWDQAEEVIKRVPSNYQFETYKNNTPLMFAIDLYAKRIADKPKSFWQTTTGGMVKMALGSAMVVLGMATLGGGGNDYWDPIKAWIRVANQNVNEEAPLPQVPQVPPAELGERPRLDRAAGYVHGNIEPQAANLIYDLRARNIPAKIGAAVDQVSGVANQGSKLARSVGIWAARLLGMASLGFGIKFCWEGGQKLKSMLSFHSRSSEIEHYKNIIDQLLQKQDLRLDTQNSDGDTALSLVRKHRANLIQDREAYQLLSDVEQLITIRGA